MKRTGLPIATVSLLFGPACACEGKQIPGLATEGGGRNFFSPIPPIPGGTNGSDGTG